MTDSYFLGEGAFSRVYLGKYTGMTNRYIKNDSSVAIKIINDLKLNEKSLKVLEDEILIMNIIKNDPHDNIVLCYDIFREDNKTYIVMEYCNSGDMRNILVGKPIKEVYVKFYFKQLVSGLKYLYDKKILHRDIKPRNILLSDNKKTLKIADFGFAKQSVIYSQDFMYDTICGSPLYMAPEIMSKAYNNQTDLWSVGMILYEMLYGQHPFSHCKNIPDLQNEISRDLYIPPLNNTNTNVTQECIDLLNKLLQKNVGKRITWEEFFKNSWLEHITTSISTHTPVRLSSSPSFSQINVRSLSTDNINIINSFLDKSMLSVDNEEIFDFDSSVTDAPIVVKTVFDKSSMLSDNKYKII
jgi:serine/threonine protein kinase